MGEIARGRPSFAAMQVRTFRSCCTSRMKNWILHDLKRFLKLDRQLGLVQGQHARRRIQKPGRGSVSVLPCCLPPQLLEGLACGVSSVGICAEKRHLVQVVYR